MIARPGGGLINPRIHEPKPKIEREPEGAFRPVSVPKHDRSGGVIPAVASNRQVLGLQVLHQLVEIQQRPQKGVGLHHLLEDLALYNGPAGFGVRGQAKSCSST